MKLKKFLKDKKQLVENFLSLSALQGISYIFPLITLPYLVRILGPEKFGLIAFAQALIQYFVIFTNYGFNLSAPRNISINRNDKAKLNQIFNSVMFIKICLAGVGFIILCVLLFFIPKFKPHFLIYIFSFGSVMGEVLFPVWFFQGMEKMKYITLLNITAKLIFVIAIFVFVRSKSDYIYVPLINSFGFIVAGILSLRVIFKNFNVTFRMPAKNNIIKELKDGWHIFISAMSVTLYTTSNVFILGLFTNNVVVGYYSAAEKIINAVRGLLIPVSQTIYPHITHLAGISKEIALNFIRKAAILVASGCFLISLAIFIFASPIVNIILGKQYQQSIIILRILAFLPLIIGLSNMFGVQTMIVFNMKKAFSKILISAGLLGMLLAIALVPPFKHIGISIAVLITEAFVTLSMFLYLKHKRIRLLH